MPSLTETDVANLALDYCGGGTISSIDDSEAKGAKTLKRLLPQVRRECLATGNWAFAQRNLDLTARVAHVDFPLADGDTAFPLPADMVRFDELLSPSPLIAAWRIDQGPQGEELILDSDETPTVRLTLDVASPAKWPPLFVKLVAAEAGRRANPQLEGDKAGRDRATADAREAKRQAASANLQTKAVKPHAGTPFTRSRMRGGGYVPRPGGHPI